jgi:hypothetical protein
MLDPFSEPEGLDANSSSSTAMNLAPSEATCRPRLPAATPRRCPTSTRRSRPS